MIIILLPEGLTETKLSFYIYIVLYRFIFTSSYVIRTTSRYR